MTHIIIHLFAQVGVGFCHLQLRRSSTEAMVARISPAEQGVLVTPFFLSDWHWAEIGQGVFKEKYTCRSHEFPCFRQQTTSRLEETEAERSWLMLAQGATAPFLLLCSARWPVPSCLLHFGVSQQALPSCAGGREAELPRLAGCEDLHRQIVLLIQSANSPAGVFL